MIGKREYRSLDDVLAHELADLYDAEKRIVAVLPKLAAAAHSGPLRDTLQKDLGESKQQLRRLQDLLSMTGLECGDEPCAAIQGLTKEAETVAEAAGDPDARDAALISTLQRMKHYEIAGYGSARAFAARLGLHDIARQLQYTLQEEAAEDRKLTELAESGINVSAAH